jgi:hypothetical protein
MPTFHNESKHGRLRNAHDLCAQRASSVFGIDQSQIAFRCCVYVDFHSALPFLRPYHKYKAGERKNIEKNVFSVALISNQLKQSIDNNKHGDLVDIMQQIEGYP